MVLERPRPDIVLAHELIHASLMISGGVAYGRKAPKNADEVDAKNREWAEGQVIENRPLKRYPDARDSGNHFERTKSSAGFMGPDLSPSGVPWTENKIRADFGLRKRLHHLGIPAAAAGANGWELPK